MKHAGRETIDRLKRLLRSLRAIPGLIEKSPGIFYRRSSAFLHFHEDPAGIFADIKLGDDWQRMPVNSSRDQTALLKAARAEFHQ